MTPKPRRIVEKIPEEVIRNDLEKYRRLALDLGASDAAIITADQIIIDDRVRLKCISPVCRGYGTCINCPPHVGDLDQMRKAIKQYKFSIFLKLEVSTRDIAGPDAIEQGSYVPSLKKLAEIVSKIEAAAFYDGYYLAAGFQGGRCKTLWCPDIECSALKTGNSCRYPLKARASMEAVGMDVYAMAIKMGWDIYPLGRDAPSPEVPFGVVCGLVLIN